MVTIPLGIGAYKRDFAGEPEIQLVNRYVEKAPTNLEEHVALIGRPGTNSLAQFAGGLIRGTYAKTGLFDSDLFVVSGPNLWRYNSAGVSTQVTGIVYNSGHPYVAWAKGEGYEFMFIADGLLLQYYDGGSRATGTMTLTPSSPPDISTQLVQIGTAYFSWSATVDAGSPAGTAAAPWLAKLGANDAESLTNLYNLINFAGIPGVDFSTALPGPNLDYKATAVTALTLTVTSTSPYADGNAIATVVTGGALAFGAATLTGGDIHTLVEIVTPDGASIKALASLASYVLASVGNTRKIFFINPGEVTIDALNFFEKESQPDNVQDMLTLSDQLLIMGDGSTENWYATGDLNLPFTPTKGLAYQRGVLTGTPVVVKDRVLLVGDDSIVYAVGAGGVERISDHGIEERIRTQLRREQGLL